MDKEKASHFIWDTFGEDDLIMTAAAVYSFCPSRHERVEEVGMPINLSSIRSDYQ